MRIAACTIIAKNYLPFARVLMSSLRQSSPDIMRIVVLVDRPDGFFDPAHEDFDVILSETLPIQDLLWFHFKYTILEVSTAIKPFALEYICERYSVDQVLYFDPDIAIYSPLEVLTTALHNASIILTPHLTSPLTDEHRPTDLDILRSGAYNLGFIGIKTCPEVARFLDWWKARLYDQCVVDLPKGLFVDQRWIDLVPGMFDGVSVLRNPGLNVAYWNLSHRMVRRSPKGYLVNGEPLSFFHFSGFEPEAPHAFSRHQNRFTLDDLGDARELVLEYRRRLYEQGYSECCKWPYAYGKFRNGFPIPDMGRPAHHELPEVVARLSDPFSQEGYRAFVDLWNQPLTGPDVSSGQVEHNLSDVFVAPISTAIESRERREAEELRRQKHTTPVVHEKILAALQGSGIWVSTEQNPVQVETLNALIGNGDAKLHLSKLARAIYESRPDLQQFFPDPCGRDSVRFLLWFLTYGAHEYRLDDVLLSPLRKQWAAVVGSLGNPLQKLWYRCVLQATAHSVGWREEMGKIRGSVRLFRAKAALRWSGRRGPRAVDEKLFSGREKLALGQTYNGSFGVNVIGYVRSEMGVGESVRCAIRAAQASGLSIAIRAVDAKGPYRLDDRSITSEDREFPHKLNLFHVNADQSELVIRRLGPEFIRGKYNIGCWNWELEEFPDKWLPAFRFFHEIWTPSTFCQTAIARKSPVPVIRMPLAIKVEGNCSVSRSDFSIPANRFVFLTIFDLLSVSERKNPIGAITAFRQVFEKSRNCHLVLKVSHARERARQMSAIAAAAAGLPVTIIDRTIDRSQVNGLLSACDCLLSLHRSEGFGLSIAEAMYMKKPVIATGYSGNTDFTRTDNAFLVEYDLTRVPRGCNPYDEGAVWAEPRLDDAVKQMQIVLNSPEICATRASRAAEHIRTHLAPEVVGKLMRERLELVLSGQPVARRKVVGA